MSTSQQCHNFMWLWMVFMREMFFALMIVLLCSWLNMNHMKIFLRSDANVWLLTYVWQYSCVIHFEWKKKVQLHHSRSLKARSHQERYHSVYSKCAAGFKCSSILIGCSSAGKKSFLKWFDIIAIVIVIGVSGPSCLFCILVHTFPCA